MPGRRDETVIHQQGADHWHVSDLEIIRGPYACYCRDCSHNVFERLVTRDNYETGFQLQGASSGNLIVDLDSYRNRDPRKNGESADGLGIKEVSGTRNVVRGARLWNNVDDGFDAWEFLSPITIEDSIAWGNGVNRWNFPDFAGDGNGFKLGGGDDDFGADHTLTNVTVLDNVADGFADNGNLGSLRIDHATAWDNEVGFDLDSSTSLITTFSGGGQRRPGGARRLRRQRQLLEHRRHVGRRRRAQHGRVDGHRTPDRGRHPT